MDPGTSHLEQLEAAERQLLVFAREINHLYQAERERAAELERALDRLRGSYLDMIKALALVVEAKDPSTRAHLQRTHDYAVALAEAVDPELAADEQDVAGLLAGLPAILSDDSPGTFSAVPRVQVPSRAGEHRRRVERLVSDETIARLPKLDVEELTRAVEVLAAEEEKVSTHRRTVQRVVDVLRGELARRYRDGTAQVSQLLE